MEASSLAAKRVKRAKRAKSVFGGIIKTLLIIFLIALMGLVGYIFKEIYDVLNIENFYEGVIVDGIELGDMSLDEAIETVWEHNQPKLDEMQIVLSHGVQKWTYNHKDIDANINVEEIVEAAYVNGREGTAIERLKAIRALPEDPAIYETTLTYDVSLISKDVAAIAKAINEEPIEPTISFNPDNNPRFTFTEEKTGKGMLVSEAMDEIISRVNEGNFSAYEIPVEILEPSLTVAEMETWTNRIAYYSTPLSGSSQNRIHNIRLSSNAFYNVTLNPGEEYSLNEATGPRGAAEGYLPAAVIKDGNRFEDEPGGGNCQTSTTLYGAAMRADLEIVDRQPHSISSTYTNIGTDASVNYPWADFVFRNNKDTPIFITKYISDGRLHVEIYGKPSDKFDEIRIESYETSRGDTPEYKEVPDPDMFEGQTKVEIVSRPKVTAVSYRVYYKDGKEVDRILEANSTYPRIIGEKHVGTKVDPATLEEEEEEVQDGEAPEEEAGAVEETTEAPSDEG